MLQRRLIGATQYSWRGLRAGWRSEEALRLQFLLAAVLVLLSFVLDVTATEQVLLILPVAGVIVVELLNSAIEAVVDRVSDEFHELSGKAKDLGSAAVFISLLTVALVWTVILFS